MVATMRDLTTRADAALEAAMGVVAVVTTAAGAVGKSKTVMLAPPAEMLTGTMITNGMSRTRRNPLQPRGDAGDAVAAWAPAWDGAFMTTCENN